MVLTERIKAIKSQNLVGPLWLYNLAINYQIINLL